MKIAHRYILREIFPSFLISLAVLTFLFIINKVFVLLDMVINKKVPLGDTLVLYFSLVPFVLSLTVPMALMLATLMAFGRLSSDMEITAIKSGGVHLFHLIFPALLFSVAMTVGMLYFNARILPEANFAFKKIHFKILENQANVAVREKTFIKLFAGYEFYIDRQQAGGLFKDVRVFNRVSPNAPLQTTLAESGWLDTNRKTLQLFFHLDRGVIMWDNVNYHSYDRLYFDRYQICLNLENQLARLSDVKKDYEEMSLSELAAALREPPDPSDPGRSLYLRTEYQKRFALPFACLALTWFCAPLGLWTRSKGFMAFVIGISMIFIYYLLFVLGEVLSQRGQVPPALGLWWANGALTAAGSVLFYLVLFENQAFRFRRRA
ncbi:MAG TPA: LptF/LptG family permease [bacterium]|nr:LptF/LptG family permease [bacterium]